MHLDPVSTGDPHVPAHNAEREAINGLQTGLATKISLPPGAATGDLLRWDGMQWLTTETRFFEGNGSPEGIIAAPVGSRYVDKIADRGSVEWVKNTGGDSVNGWATAIGFFALSGQVGTDSLSGPSNDKRATVFLDPAIFKGVAPSQVFLSIQGGYGAVTHAYLVSKTATQFVMAGERLDNGAFTSASTILIGWMAVV